MKETTETKPLRPLKTGDELRAANARRQRLYRARALARRALKRREQEGLADSRVVVEDHEVEVEL